MQKLKINVFVPAITHFHCSRYYFRNTVNRFIMRGLCCNTVHCVERYTLSTRSDKIRLKTFFFFAPIMLLLYVRMRIFFYFSAMSDTHASAIIRPRLHFGRTCTVPTVVLLLLFIVHFKSPRVRGRENYYSNSAVHSGEMRCNSFLGNF